MRTSVRRLSAAVTAGAMSAAVLSTMFAGPAAQAAVPIVSASVLASTSGTYVVRSGDTLGGIAARNGMSLAAIFSANNMGMSTIIYPGQKISLGQGVTTPPATTPAAPAPAPASATHLVKSGDTLGGIAAKYQVSLSSVLAANGMNLKTIIYPGQKILLGVKTAPAPVVAPAPAPVAVPTPAPTPAPAPAPAGVKTYIVQAGDTLSRIASSNGVSLSALLAANGMNLQTIIYPGQKITITGSATTTTPTAPSTTASPSVAELKAMVADTARRMGVDPSLALAFAMQESSFRQDVTSSAGAIGTMQVMPTSGEWASQLVGRQLNLRNTQDNITAGVAIISALLATSPSKEIAIASYYQGQYSVMNRGMYEDTKAYVASVLRYQTTFQ